MTDFFAGGDGYSSQEIFNTRKRKSCFAYTYDDIILLPNHIQQQTGSISLEGNITRNIRVKVPLLSSPMDTVTEHKMAIGMALQVSSALSLLPFGSTLF